MQLRNYQKQAVENTVRYLTEIGDTSVIVHLGTGGGKTVISMETFKRMLNLETQRGLFIAPWQSLVLQSAIRFKQYWHELGSSTEIQHPSKSHLKRTAPSIGTVMNTTRHPDARLIIGSIATLLDRSLQICLKGVKTQAYLDRTNLRPENLRGESAIIYKKWQDLGGFDPSTPILKSDIIVDQWGSITLNPNSKRPFLVSPAIDQILANGGNFDLITYDECHHAVSDGAYTMIQRIWELDELLSQPRTKLVGLTATPARNDGKGLSSLFDRIAFSKSLTKLQEEGWLVPFAPPKRVAIQVGKNNVDRVIDSTDWTERLLEVWHKEGEDRQTIAFMPKVEDSIKFCEFMNEHGVPTAHVDGSTTIHPDGKRGSVSDREDVFAAFEQGKIKIITNYGVMTEGIDLPVASGLWWFRPTDNEVLLTQAIGRVLRLYPDKKDALIIDGTMNDLNILPIGTLMGFDVDPLTNEYVPTTDLDNITIQDGMAVADVLRPNQLIDGDTVVSLAQILSKAPDDWHVDHKTGIFSLGVSEQDTLIIYPPDREIELYLRKIERKVLEQEDLDTLEIVEYALNVFGSYTGWHVQKDGNRYVVPENKQGVKTFLASDSSISSVQAAAIMYVNDNLERVQTFTKKSSAWKKLTPSDGQIQYLKSLRFKPEQPLDRGEAAKWITHLVGVRPVAKQVQKVYNGLSAYLTEKGIDV